MRSLLRFAGRNRIYVLALAIVGCMAVSAPNFATATNAQAILKASSTHLLPAVGLTLVMIGGNLDLSFGTVLTLGGALAIGLQPRLGWGGSIGTAVAAGLAVGLLNGLLVAKARVNSFIATLGTLTILQAAINIYTRGGTVTVDSFAFGDWLDMPVWGVLCPRVLMCVAVVLVGEWVLRRTPPGRNLLVVGANPATAWYAGISTSGYTIGAFVVSGVLAAAGGVLFAGSLSSANPTMGDSSLMVVIAAVIIGGTSMSGGRGSVLASMVAVLALVSLVNGLACFGAQPEVQLVASGAVLAAVVLYDAVSVRLADRMRGARPDLLREAVVADRVMEEAR